VATRNRPAVERDFRAILVGGKKYLPFRREL
jgi:hypothetical protein